MCIKKRIHDQAQKGAKTHFRTPIANHTAAVVIPAKQLNGEPHSNKSPTSIKASQPRSSPVEASSISPPTSLPPLPPLRSLCDSSYRPIHIQLTRLSFHSPIIRISRNTRSDNRKAKKKLAFLRCSDSFIPFVRHNHTFAHHASRNNSPPFGNLLASRYYCRFPSCCSSSITRSGGRGTTELRNTYGSATKGIPAATTSEVGRRYRGHGD